MGIQTEQYIRKPFSVEAVRVTVDNIEDVAQWCEGHIKTENEGSRAGRKYVKVRVRDPKNDRQTKAFVGDWVLYTNGYKVYTHQAFQSNFDKVESQEPQADPTTDIPAAEPVLEEPTTTPQGEEIEVVPATPQAIADVVNEQQPVETPVADTTPPGGDTRLQTETDDKEKKLKHEPVAKSVPTDKRVLTHEEQKRMTPAEVRGLIQSGDVILEQDLAETR